MSEAEGVQTKGGRLPRQLWCCLGHPKRSGNTTAPNRKSRTYAEYRGTSVIQILQQSPASMVEDRDNETGQGRGGNRARAKLADVCVSHDNSFTKTGLFGSRGNKTTLKKV